jgi:hypothetical protein
VSKRRLTFGAALILGSMLAPAGPAAQEPSLDDVLDKAAAYVADFRRQLSQIVAEETYRQEIANTARIGVGYQILPRTLRSDLVLIKPADADRYVELRDVFEVDGKQVRARQSRLEELLRDDSGRANAGIQTIINESARYNIGSVTRNINTPLMALQFLDAAYQPRFRFKHVAKAGKPVFKDVQDQAVNDTPVFRVSTEMWTIEYQERGRNTVIRTPNGDRLPAHGRFWINPNNGSVLISELIVDGLGVIATVTVSYQSEPLMGFLVPVQMRETYIRGGERIAGTAEYGRFRLIRK